MSTHQAGIIHRDIKPENILCKSDPNAPSTQKNMHAVIIDYGLSVFDKSNEKKGTGVVGTPLYLPPEIFTTVLSTKSNITPEDYLRINTIKNDIWAMGLVLAQLYKEELSPWLHDWIIKFMNLKMNIKVALSQRELFTPPIPSNASDLEKLIRSMLSEDPNARPTAQELLVGFDRIAKLRSPTAPNVSFVQ